MTYNFDTIIERKNTDSVKYDFAEAYKMPKDVLPMWVADMDFKTPDCVIDALVERSRHGVFGYSDTSTDYIEILQEWFSRRFHWSVEPSWLVKTPGVVYAVCAALQAYTEKGDSVLIQPPVYYPFKNSILENERRLVNNPLILKDGRYYMDFDDFEAKIKEENVKLFILCNPHNPVGRVWTEDELRRVGEICLRNDVVILSDEIHQDFVYPGHTHRVFVTLDSSFSDITVTCTSPSKSFNLAGLQISNIFIPSKPLRKRFKDALRRTGLDEMNAMGIAACKAAYSHGESWLSELLVYLAGNVNYINQYLTEHMPAVKLIQPEGTYLVWMDFRELGYTGEELDHLMAHKAGLWLDGGNMFGREGEGFQRFNIACPRETVKLAMNKLKTAIPL